MLGIVSAHPLPFIIAVLIGIATAWWIWGRMPNIDVDSGDGDLGDRDVEPFVATPEPAPVAAAAVAPVAAAAAPAAAAKPDIAQAVGDPDDLKLIKGIGPKLEKLCNSLGVMRFDQIAAWTARDVAKVDDHLGSFKGRIDRDEWVAQAKLLAAGKVDEHVAKYGA